MQAMISEDALASDVTYRLVAPSSFLLPRSTSRGGKVSKMEDSCSIFHKFPVSRGGPVAPAVVCSGNHGGRIMVGIEAGLVMSANGNGYREYGHNEVMITVEVEGKGRRRYCGRGRSLCVENWDDVVSKLRARDVDGGRWKW